MGEKGFPSIATLVRPRAASERLAPSGTCSEPSYTLPPPSSHAHSPSTPSFAPPPLSTWPPPPLGLQPARQEPARPLLRPPRSPNLVIAPGRSQKRLQMVPLQLRLPRATTPIRGQRVVRTRTSGIRMLRGEVEAQEDEEDGVGELRPAGQVEGEEGELQQQRQQQQRRRQHHGPVRRRPSPPRGRSAASPPGRFQQQRRRREEAQAGQRAAVRKTLLVPNPSLDLLSGSMRGRSLCIRTRRMHLCLLQCRRVQRRRRRAKRLLLALLRRLHLRARGRRLTGTSRCCRISR